MKVFVVDSHAIYRRGLVASLELLDRVESVAHADGVQDARRHAALHEADIVILDTSIAGGREFMATFVDGGGGRVIACTSACDEDSVVGAVEAGAGGHLPKENPPPEQLPAGDP